ncbi:unnamed protein product [Effrenium voratum]|uniref:Uncharacterized protein n=1 Tax=Effrenium voratum TaxID=2562239 RepID=A0AA36IDF1_9DINO|nr:unnamed protein product [Effrenium voratum]CAJ1414319.1 unnamed protein product [Effrenium voratum]
MGAAFCTEHPGVQAEGPTCALSCSAQRDIDNLQNSGSMTIGLTQKPVQVSDCNDIEKFCKKHRGKAGTGPGCSFSCSSKGQVKDFQQTEPESEEVDCTRMAAFCRKHPGVEGVTGETNGQFCSFSCTAQGFLTAPKVWAA